MARKHRPRRPRSASVELPSWPLDQPAEQTPAGQQSEPSRERALLESSAADTFFCKRCRHGVRAVLPPEGWIRAQERQGVKERESSRLYITRGLFCGLPCLALWAAAEVERTP